MPLVGFGPVREMWEKGLVRMPAIANIGRRFVVAIVAVGVVISNPCAASAQGGSGADLKVRLSAVGSLLLAGARYTVSITNNGPEPLTSATVVVRLDPRAFTTSGSPACPFDTTADTLTCTFGALPVGGTATSSESVYFVINDNRATLDATATRTASAPSDPSARNDTDSVACTYQAPPPFGTGGPLTTCESK